jgi:hypothetical protein
LTLTPVKEVLLTIPKALEDELTMDSGLKLYIDPSYSKEHKASVTATISALPINPNPKEKNILDQLNVGDEVAVSYQIVADFSFGSDADRFMAATEDNDYYKEFFNAKGHSVRVQALPKRAGLKGIVWAGIYLNKKGELIDGVQGDEDTLERWLSQFPFGKTDDYTFNNFFEYEGKDYWKAGLDQIFAVRRKGHLVAVGDRIICKPIDEEVPDNFFIDGSGLMQKMIVRRQDRARVLSGGKEKGIKKDEIVHFDPRHCEKYEFFGKQYFLIKQEMVLGKWN